jgi:uncharacterized protein YcfL|tara:strand:+ start:378 stop:824 length:447 start_codon:yes stop_codon:yes gene_type:complete
MNGYFERRCESHSLFLVFLLTFSLRTCKIHIMAQHRTPQQLLAEALEKVKALQTKVAESNLKNHPRMASLLNREKEIKMELTKAAKWLDPEKGLEMRIAKLTTQITEAKHKLANAGEIKAELSEQLENIQAEKAQVADELSKEGLLNG